MKALTNVCVVVLFLATAFAAGCGKKDGSLPASSAGTAGRGEKSPPIAAAIPEKDDHPHDGWWCDEHGVPEEACGQCDSKLAAEFQKQGDWCKDHDRPDSQCFVCHPELEEKFAAQYVAKYGKQPPKPE